MNYSPEELLKAAEICSEMAKDESGESKTAFLLVAVTLRVTALEAKAKRTKTI